jgi:hypothetical protein
MVPQPPLWVAVWNTVGLPRWQAKRLWQAVAQATWPTTRQYRQQLVVYAGTIGTEAYAKYLSHELVPPARLLWLLEQLVAEQLVTRREVRDAEEAVLKWTTATGTWHPKIAQPDPLVPKGGLWL